MHMHTMAPRTINVYFSIREMFLMGTQYIEHFFVYIYRLATEKLDYVVRFGRYAIYIHTARWMSIILLPTIYPTKCIERE